MNHCAKISNLLINAFIDVRYTEQNRDVRTEFRLLLGSNKILTGM